jgi:hypothetical protein
MIPFGWMLVEIDQTPDQELENIVGSYRNDQQEWWSSIKAYQSSLIKQKEQETLRQAEIQRQKEEAKVKAEETERLRKEFEVAEQARRANLSEIDLLIEDLQKPGFDYKACFKTLMDKYTGEDLQRLAMIYKQLFVKASEWEVGSAKKKQFEKVERIKKILDTSTVVKT